MATLRNALKRFVRNSSILDGPTLHFGHCYNFNTFYDSRHAHTESRNGDQAQVSGPSQNSQSRKPDKIISGSAGVSNFNSGPSRPTQPNATSHHSTDPCRLFVAGLSKFTTIESMNEHFRKFGNVSNCGIKINKETGLLTNSGYVEFESAVEANIALNALPHVIDGKEVGLMPYGGKETRTQRRNYKIVIRRLPEEISQTTLRNFYSQFGEILACYIMRTEANESRDFAFVVFNSEEAVTRALNSLPHYIDGEELTDVKRAGGRDRKLTLRVLDLSPQTTEESLRIFYSKFGKLTRCDIRNNGSVKDIATEKSTLVGFVAFESKQELDRALEAEPHIIDGSEVFLQYLTNDFDLWIDGVPEGLTEDSLYDFFAQYGELRDCRIHSSVSGTNHASVCYTSKDEVLEALNNEHVIEGTVVDVRKASEVAGSMKENFV
ncbi:RNA recognition motif domain-containing protein [Ditylenchus destructor]|nr:RNA recognition motif domain-containing protein [Ditylenchus destructor]